MEKPVVLITGGNGNIAKRIVKRYLDAECMVIVVDIHEAPSFKEFEQNENYQYYKVDVTKIEQIQELYKLIEKKYGKLTHIISAAGRPSKTEIEGGIEGVTIEDINQCMQLNLIGHIYITKILLPLLEKENSKNKTITLISSINALKSFNLPIYSAAKSGMYGFMYSLTKELGKKHIRINVVSPGTVPTDEDLEKDGDFYNYRYKSMLALHDFTKPEDIADVLFSITHIMKAVTGQNIVVDSGQTV